MKMAKLGIFLAVGIGTIGATPSEALEAVDPFTTSQAVLEAKALTDYEPRHSATQILAQNTELGCRQTTVSTGVYVQPNLASASQGMLTSAQTVRLESRGEGWARINQPLVGWVQSMYLTPAVSCDSLNGSPTIQNPPEPITALPPGASASNSQQNPTNTAPVAAPFRAPVKVTCDVLPADGLVVRSEPAMEGRTYLTTIAPGTHEFQFTNAKVTQSEAGDRRWVYITAPSTGWITLGLEGAPLNLGGQECG